LLIAGVEADSPAEKAAIFQGDVLVAIGEISIRYPDDLLNQLGKDLIGEEINLKMIRAGKIKQIKVIVGER
jgi:S1-C subfamily serine protease